MDKIIQRVALAAERYARQIAEQRFDGGPKPPDETLIAGRARYQKSLDHIQGPLTRKASRAKSRGARRRALWALNRICSGSAQMPATDPRLD